MRIPKMLMPNRFRRVILFLALGYFMTGTNVQAQCNTTSQGYNAVGTGCTSGTQGSFAIVDASQFSGNDICTKILASFEQYYPSGNTNNYGIIVDARGLSPTLGCSTNPWGLPSGEMPPSSVVLLPAGTIQLSATLQMPQFARLIGEGSGTTILQAAHSFNGDIGNMIELGPSSSPGGYCTKNPMNSAYSCPGVEVEHLKLDGNGQSGVNGIANYYGQELSYVEDVAFSNMGGTALSVTYPQAQDGNSQNSGPYSKLTMSSVGTCLRINGFEGTSGITVGTRGIHGLTCSTSSSSGAAIYVDGENNSLEDISLTNAGTTEYGILIGDSAAAQNNVLFNIRGSGFTYLIDLSGSYSTSQTNCPGTGQLPGVGVVAYNVCDITIMGVTNQTSGTTTIYDQVSGATLSEPHVGMYILGEPVQYGSTNNYFLGNSHFTTSPYWPTWVVGSSQQQGVACPSVGSLYSVTSGSAPTLLECEAASGGAKWVMVK